ncbi:MAG: hypothetical protein II025_03615, partial [Ruminococcus sp.]|nr:hypothetical protein [Ruminococcus sp.]
MKVLKSKLLFAVALNLIIAILCIWVTTFSYANSSDYYNSILICRDHFYYSNTINYILAVIVGTIQYAITDINAFVMVEVALSFAAFTSITFVLADKYNYRKAFVFSMVINILFALNHYSEIDSTKTSALLLAGGFLLVLNAIRNKRYTLSCWAGVAEILLGTFYCYVYFFVALAFAIAFFFGDMMAKKKYRLDFQKFFWYFRPFLLMFIFITLLALGANQFSYSINHSTNESAEYYEYAHLSEAVDTLPFPDFTENREEFASVGIDDNCEYELLKMNYYDADKMLTTDSLKMVHNLQLEKSEKTVLYALGDVFNDIWGHIVRFDAFAIAGLVYLLISAVFIVYHKNRFSFFPLFYAITALGSSVVIRYLFDGADHRIYGIWVFMIVLLLFSFNFEVERSQKPSSKLRMSNGYMIISCAVLVALFAAYTTVYVFSHPDKEDDAPWNLITEINRNPDCYYVMDNDSMLDFDHYTENYMHPLWGFRYGYLENLDSFGYFHKTEMLRKRNLPENIYQALLSNHKIYV